MPIKQLSLTRGHANMFKNKTKNIMRPLLLIFVLLPNLAFAYPIVHYMGFGTGYTWSETSFNDQLRTLGATEETPSYSDVTRADLPWQGFVGFRFHPNYGIEVGYRSYGSIEFDKTLTAIDTSTNKLAFGSVREAEVSTQGFYIEHVFSYAALQSLILQARAGVLIGSATYTDIETLTTVDDNDNQIEGTPQPSTSSDGFVKAQFALSALYKASDVWFWRLQVNQIDIDHRDEKESFSHWFTSLSVEYQLQE